MGLKDIDLIEAQQHQTKRGIALAIQGLPHEVTKETCAAFLENMAKLHNDLPIIKKEEPALAEKIEQYDPAYLVQIAVLVDGNSELPADLYNNLRFIKGFRHSW